MLSKSENRPNTRPCEKIAPHLIQCFISNCDLICMGSVVLTQCSKKNEIASNLNNNNYCNIVLTDRVPITEQVKKESQYY